MSTELPVLVDTEIVNDHVNIEITNYRPPGEVPDVDINIARTFRVLDVYMDGSDPMIKVKYFDNELAIKLTSNDWEAVKVDWDEVTT